MRAAVPLRDVVGEAKHGLVIAVVPPQRTLHLKTVTPSLDHDRPGNQRGLVAVEIAHEGLDATLVDNLLTFLDRVTPIGQYDTDARVEEGKLAQAMLQRRPVELRHA